jgi:hypothetical protein
VLEGGEIDEVIATGLKVFACTLGGDDGRTLFLCLAPDSSHAKRAAATEARLATPVRPARAGRP